MAGRKAVDDPHARNEVADKFTGIAATAGADHEVADTLMALFRYAEYETVTNKVAGEEITMRRVVLTGHWDVQH